MSCNQACAARDADALAEALRAGRGSPDSDTCEIAAAWNALECLRVLRAHGCEMNEAACLVTAVRYGARDCVLWLKDGVLFPPPTGPAPLARMVPTPSQDDAFMGASRRVILTSRRRRARRSSERIASRGISPP